MNIVKLIFTIILAFFLMALSVSLFIPSSYKVERSTIMKAPVETVFDHVNDLRKNELWSPWQAQDATMEIEYGDIVKGLGAAYSWTSEQMGEGSLRIIKTQPYKRIETYLEFGERGTALGYWDFEEVEEGLRVTNGFKGDVGWNLIQRFFNVLIDGQVGPSFEAGLVALRRVSAQAAAQEQKTM